MIIGETGVGHFSSWRSWRERKLDMSERKNWLWLWCLLARTHTSQSLGFPALLRIACAFCTRQLLHEVPKDPWDPWASGVQDVLYYRTANWTAIQFPFGPTNISSFPKAGFPTGEFRSTPRFLVWWPEYRKQPGFAEGRAGQWEGFTAFHTSGQSHLLRNHMSYTMWQWPCDWLCAAYFLLHLDPSCVCPCLLEGLNLLWVLVSAQWDWKLGCTQPCSDKVFLWDSESIVCEWSLIIF